MISHKLEQEIRTFCDHIQSTSPLFQNAAAGKLTPAHVRRYVTSLHHLVAHTPINLQLAVRAAAVRGQADLEAHYRKKIAEEVGHDQWAEADVKVIDGRFGANADDVGASRWIDAVIAYNQKMIEHDPKLYTVYILLTEFTTVLAGPPLIELMRSRCGITPDMLSVVGNHAELDKAHVSDGLQEIDRLIPEAAEADCLAALHQGMKLFEAFFADVGAVH